MASPALLKRVLALPPALRRSFWSSPSRNQHALPEIYDVVCIGGGPAGLSFVSALKAHPATRDLKIALIDSQQLKPSRGQDETLFSNRCSSLTPSSVRFLRNIGAWNHIDESRTAPYHAMDVWDGVSGSKIHFNPAEDQSLGIADALSMLVPGNRFSGGRQPYARDASNAVVATMCENNNLTTALLERLNGGDAAKMTTMDSTKVDSIELGPAPEREEALDLSLWPVVTTSQGQIAARLLVGADGANSPVRQFADIPSHGWDYNQHGVVATLDVDQSFSEYDLRTAYQRFLPTGPIALLPLPNKKASLVWSNTVQNASKLKQLPPDAFAAMVNAAFRLLPADIDYMLTHTDPSQLVSEVSWRISNTTASETGVPLTLPQAIGVQNNTAASFPLKMRHASTYTGHRVALIGDAAHTMHPLAGQGLNLGLADAESLAKQIVYGVEHGMDIGSCWCLDGYNSERWAANNAMLGVVDKLQKLYGVSTGPVVWGRTLGLEIVNRLGPLKGALMGAASGSR